MKTDAPAILRPLPRPFRHSETSFDVRRAILAEHGIALDAIAEGRNVLPPAALAGHIESLIGYASIPIGAVGPLRIRGEHARGAFYVPLATTEGALVASYQRGARVIGRGDGAIARCLEESVSRAPCFVFGSLLETERFVAFVREERSRLPEIVAGTSRHARLIDIEFHITGRDVHVVLQFTTGDASGQNMVTLAAEAICRHLVERAPVPPRRWYLEANLSGDKKATAHTFARTRGRRVVAEAVLPRSAVQRHLHTEPLEMVRYYELAQMGAAQSGAVGAQGHFANALAALFIACGQDVACVAESATGLTRLALDDDGALYASVLLPNLMVGTVGGGTGLATARTCLSMLGCAGDGHARKFAEICAAVVLAGEVSIMAALTAGHFAEAHRRHGRKAKEAS